MSGGLGDLTIDKNDDVDSSIINDKVNNNGRSTNSSGGANEEILPVGQKDTAGDNVMTDENAGAMKK